MNTFTISDKNPDIPVFQLFLKSKTKFSIYSIKLNKNILYKETAIIVHIK